MTKTRWGFAAAGKISHDFATALATLPKSEHQFVAVAAQDLSRARKFAEIHNIEKVYGSYNELSQDRDIEVVYIGTIHPTHFEIAKMMLNAGKHVLCEKPLTTNAKKSSELIKLARSRGLFLMEAVWSRCFPIYTQVKNVIDRGDIGEVKQIICSLGFKANHIQRLNQKELGGGSILDVGVYTLQLCTFIFGIEKPEVIKAVGHLNADGVDISMSASLKYKGNRTATIFTHSEVNLPNEAVIIGTKGKIKIPDFWCPIKAELPSGIVEITLPTGAHPFNFHNSAGLSFEAVEVRTCILKGLLESPKMTHEDSLLVAEMQDELRKQLGVIYNGD